LIADLGARQTRYIAIERLGKIVAAQLEAIHSHCRDLFVLRMLEKDPALIQVFKKETASN
jgi:hypothetical protein